MNSITISEGNNPHSDWIQHSEHSSLLLPFEGVHVNFILPPQNTDLILQFVDL